MRIVAILDRMPDWTAFSGGKPHLEERAEIERAVKEIAQYDLDTVRSAVAYYQQEYRGDLSTRIPGKGTGWAPGKLFLLIQYLFNLPEKVTRASPYWRFFGSWTMPFSGDVRHPKTSDSVDLRWPWLSDSSGRWQLVGRFVCYIGEEYDALGAFDFYRKHFGPRIVRDGQHAAEAGL